jgi:hypothetical protein
MRGLGIPLGKLVPTRPMGLVRMLMPSQNSHSEDYYDFGKPVRFNLMDKGCESYNILFQLAADQT